MHMCTIISKSTKEHNCQKNCQQKYSLNELLIVFMCVCAQSLSHVWLFVSAWTVAHQAPLFMEFHRQEGWSELPFPVPEDLPDPGIELVSLGSPVLAGRFFTTMPFKWNWENNDSIDRCSFSLRISVQRFKNYIT